MRWRFMCQSEKSKLGFPPHLSIRVPPPPDHAQQLGLPSPRQGIAVTPGEVS